MELTRHLARIAATAVAATTLVGGVSLTPAHACEISSSVQVRDAVPVWETNNYFYPPSLRFRIDGLGPTDSASYETAGYYYGATSGSDFKAQKGSVTGDNDGRVYVTVPVVADTTEERRTEMLFLRITGVTACLDVEDGTAVGKIFDDDSPANVSNIFDRRVSPSGSGDYVDVPVRISMSKPVPNGQSSRFHWQTVAGTLPATGYEPVDSHIVSFLAGEREGFAQLRVRRATACGESFEGTVKVRITSWQYNTEVSETTATVTVEDNTITCFPTL